MLSETGGTVCTSLQWLGASKSPYAHSPSRQLRLISCLYQQGVQAVSLLRISSAVSSPRGFPASAWCPIHAHLTTRHQLCASPRVLQGPMAGAGGGGGALARLVARLNRLLFKREKQGIDEVGNVYWR